MKDQADSAARKWQESVGKIRAAQQPTERVRLDSEIARQHYEKLSAQLAEAEMVEEMERRQQGLTLELLEPPTLRGWWLPQVWIGALAGFAIGALVACAAILLRRPRRVEALA